MRHRFYNLEHASGVFGFELSDLAVGGAPAIITIRMLDAVMPFFVAVACGIGLGVAIGGLWIYVKERNPKHFLKHIALWLTQRSEYHVTKDLESHPIIVDPEAIKRIRHVRR